MARLDIVPVTVLGPYLTGQPAADSLDVVFNNPATASDGISFSATGREILLVQNTSGGALTWTLSATAGREGRTVDLGPYSLAAGEFAAYKLTELVGWLQAGGKVWAVGSTTGVKFAVLRF